MPDFIAGLDLGQMSDYTALAILRREAVRNKAGEPLENHRGRPVYGFAVVHLQRFELGTAYPIIVEAVKKVMRRRELHPGPLDAPTKPTLAIDASGIGRPVVDMVIDANISAEISPVTITGGNDFRRDPWHGNHGPTAFWVPKRDLVGCVQAALGSGRLRIAERLTHAELLRRELRDFRVNVTPAANETFNAREGQHDDLLLAVAVAVWVGETDTPSYGLGKAVEVKIEPRDPYAAFRAQPDAEWNRTTARHLEGDSAATLEAMKSMADFGIRRERRRFYGN